MRPWALTSLAVLLTTLALGCPAAPADKAATKATGEAGASPVVEGELTEGAKAALDRKNNGEALADAANELGSGPTSDIDAPPPPPPPPIENTTSQPAPAEITRESVKLEDQVAIMSTTKGDIYIFFYPVEAPAHVRNFIYLAQKDALKDSPFHRVIPNFVIQGGEIKNPAYTEPVVSVKNEKNPKRIHIPGALAAARTPDPDSANSQFYFAITREATAQLDSGYTVYGQAFRGLEEVIKRVADDRKNLDQDGSPSPPDTDPTNNDKILSVKIVDAGPYAAEIAKFKADHAITD